MKFSSNTILNDAMPLKYLQRQSSGGDAGMSSNGIRYTVPDGHNNNIDANMDRTVSDKQFEDLPDNAASTRRTLELCLAETLGSFMLMFFGCAGHVSGFDQTRPLPSMQGGVMFGFVVSTIIMMFGHISGAHLNPSVTIAAVVMKNLRPLEAVVYIISQFIGCILGYAMVGVITPEDILAFGTDPERGLCATIPANSISDYQAFLVEFLATSLLLLACCGVWDHRNAHQGDSTPVKFALTVILCSVSLGPYTGGSMNTARSLAPAFVNNIWTRHWIYWVAPNLAAVVTPLVYMYAFERKRLEKSLNNAQPRKDVCTKSIRGVSDLHSGIEKNAPTHSQEKK